MAIERTRSLRKASGGRLKDNRKSRQFAKVNSPILASVGDEKVRQSRTIGGGTKLQLYSGKKISVADSAKKTVVISEIESVLDNGANKNFVQRNIFTKGAIVQTKLGKVRITSRPGQTPILSGVLVA